MKDDRAYLEHIRDALHDIATYTNVGREGFFTDRMRQDATLRKLQVIGQAVKSLSEDMKSRQRRIPWKEIAGLSSRGQSTSCCRRRIHEWAQLARR